MIVQQQKARAAAQRSRSQGKEGFESLSGQESRKDGGGILAHLAPVLHPPVGIKPSTLKLQVLREEVVSHFTQALAIYLVELLAVRA